MNILIFSWRGPGHPKAGGAEEVTHQYAKGWVAAGHGVTLFTSSYKDALSEETIDGVKVIRKGSEVLSVHLWAFIWYIFKKSNSYDLVFDHFHGIPFFTPFYVRKPKISFIHETAKGVWGLNTWPNPFNLIPFVLGETFESLIFIFYKKVSFVTVSNSTKEDLISFGIKKDMITVLPNGTNLYDMPKIPSKETKKTLTYLGTISKDKGIEDALQCFSILSKSDSNYQFWVIGKGDDKYVAQMKTLAKRLRIKNIVFWGFVDEKQKFIRLSKSHLLVTPSVKEGWGLVVIEANSVGTPVIGYNVSGLKDSIIDNKTGVLTSSNTPENLAKEIELILADKNGYKKMKTEAEKWAKQFNWESSIKKSLDYIEDTYKKNESDISV